MHKKLTHRPKLRTYTADQHSIEYLNELMWFCLMDYLNDRIGNGGRLLIIFRQRLMVCEYENITTT